MWVFKRLRITSDTDAWIVGFYDPDGDFISTYEFNEKVTAAQQVHFLNGGN